MSPQIIENNDVIEVRRRNSPRQGGRASPGARISWLTTARSGVSGQVMLNDKGKQFDPNMVGLRHGAAAVLRV